MLRAEFHKRFPELSSFDLSPAGFAKIVLKLDSVEDISNVDLSDLIPQNTISIADMATTTILGKPLSELERQRCTDYANEVIALHEINSKIRLICCSG